MRTICATFLMVVVGLTGCSNSPAEPDSSADAPAVPNPILCPTKTWTLATKGWTVEAASDASWDFPISTGPYTQQGGLHIPFQPPVDAGYIRATGTFRFTSDELVQDNPFYGEFTVLTPDRIDLAGPATVQPGDEFGLEFDSEFQNSTELVEMNLVSFYLDPYEVGGLRLMSGLQSSTITFSWPCAAGEPSPDE